MENREPVGAFLFPDASSIIGARHVFPIKCALDFHRVDSHDDVLLIGKHVEVAKRKRFHVPLLHVIHFLLEMLDSFGINAAEIFIDEGLERVGVFIFECLPG